MRKILVFIGLVVFASCNRAEKKSEAQNDTAVTLIQKGDSVKQAHADPKTYPYQYSKIEVSTFPVEKGGFGYMISVNNEAVIYQPFPPAWGGEKGFLSREDAQKVGEFVAKKIVNKEMPPVVKVEDYNKLNIKLPQ